MAERIDRRDDKRIYQPALHSDRVIDLYLLKGSIHKPMTVILDTAVREYVQNYKTGEVEYVEDQPWEEHREEIETLNQIDAERIRDQSQTNN